MLMVPDWILEGLGRVEHEFMFVVAKGNILKV